MYGNIIRARNVNHTLPLGIDLLRRQGDIVVSRGMETIEAPGPVSTVYYSPMERVLFDPVRDANPFFHLMEALWIIGGGKYVALPKYFMNNIGRFSDNGVTFHGAYGHRLRSGFGFDQLQKAISVLKDKPDSRQVVMSIWDPMVDMGVASKDIPCNDMVMLKIRSGKLNMTVCNRSNDMIWGAYGANVVQFSMLQEWLAAMVGVGVGYYVQQSDSFHAYTDNPYWKFQNTPTMPTVYCEDPYWEAVVEPYSLAQSAEEAAWFREDCEHLCELAETSEPISLGMYKSRYFGDVVVPVIDAYDKYKKDDYCLAKKILLHCQASDWRLAMTQWIQRRMDKAATKEQA